MGLAVVVLQASLKAVGPRLFPTCVSGVEVAEEEQEAGFHSCLLIWGLPLR